MCTWKWLFHWVFTGNNEADNWADGDSNVTAALFPGPPDFSLLRSPTGMVMQGNDVVELRFANLNPTPKYFSNPFTIEVDAMWTNFGSVTDRISSPFAPLFYCENANGHNVLLGIAPELSGSGGMQLYLQVTSAGGAMTLRSTENRLLQLNLRYHIIATVSEKKLRLFINGEVVGAVTTALANTLVDLGDVNKCYAGAGTNAPSFVGFRGEMTSLAIAEGAVTEEHVAIAYLGAPFTLILQHSWDFTSPGALSIRPDQFVDSIGNAYASVEGNPTTAGGTDPSGIILNSAGGTEHIELHLEGYMLGDAMTIEAYLKWIPPLQENSPFFHCGILGTRKDEILVSNIGTSGDIRFSIYQENTGLSVSGGNANTLNDGGFHHVVATVFSNVMSIYVDGVKMGTTYTPSVDGAEPNAMKRMSCFIGKPLCCGDAYLRGHVRYLKIYSGGMDGAQVAAAYAIALGTSGPTSAPTGVPSGAPTSAPTGAPSGSPSSAPSIAPTSAPTQVLGQLVSYSSTVSIPEYQWQRDDGVQTTDHVLLRVTDSILQIKSVLVPPEVATIACSSRNTSVATVVPPEPITLDASGTLSPQGRNGFDLEAVPDLLQLDERKSLVECTVMSSNAEKVVARLTIGAVVRGITQPSIGLFCTNASLPETCATDLTTNGGARIEVIGGSCAMCPQPPFESSNTAVYVNGVMCNSTVSANGKILVFTTPTILQMIDAATRAGANGNGIHSSPPRHASASTFLFNAYYTLVIRTHRTSSSSSSSLIPALAGEVILGPGAAGGGGGNNALLCASRKMCPPGTPSTSGVFYLKRCLGYPDPTVDKRWNTTTSPSVAALFAYGIPPTCRACPTGCQCPGGDRCHTLEGFYIEGESLGNDVAPRPCHPDHFIASLRCLAWSPSIGATRCALGYAGVRCGACAAEYYIDDTAEGACMKCPAKDDITMKVLALATVFVVITTMSFILVAIVQTAFGRDIKSGHVRSARFAGWIVTSLVVQAQIGRTGSSDQPKALQEYYKLLQIFELNPAGALPASCSGAGGTNYIATIALSLSVVSSLLFVLLSMRVLQKRCAACGDSVERLSERTCCSSRKETTEVDDEQEEGGSGGGGLKTHSGNDHGGEEVQVSTVIEMAAMEKNCIAGGWTVHIDAVGTPYYHHAATGETAWELPAGASDSGSGAATKDTAPVEKERARALLLAYRLEFSPHSATAADEKEAEREIGSDQMKKKRCVYKKKKKTEKKKKKTGGGGKKARKIFGMFRKMLASTVIVLHPLVANSAFKAIHCIQVGSSASWILATAPTVNCFGADHIFLWLLSVIAIAVSIVGFPMYICLALSNTASWYDPCKRRLSTLTKGKFFAKHEHGRLGSLAVGDDDEVESNVVGFAVTAENKLFKHGPDSREQEDVVGIDDATTGIDLSLVTPQGGVESDFRNSYDDGVSFEEAYADDGNIPTSSAPEGHSQTGTFHKRGGFFDDGGPGPVSGGMLCRHHVCIGVLYATRDAFDAKHHKGVYPERREAYLAFTKGACISCAAIPQMCRALTQYSLSLSLSLSLSSPHMAGEYKPEFFYIRLVFFCAITLLAFSNAFVNPDSMLDAQWTQPLLVTTQLFRYALCACAVTVPCVLLITLQPMKRSAAWKLPLRLLCALVSIGMLTLNLAAWWVQRAKKDQKTSWVEGDAMNTIACVTV